MKKILQAIVLTMLLALAAAPAWALGLGQLQLKSKLGEPLLAEIPVISADPMELQDLEARLAAPETFLRVGLPLPDKMVSDLKFALAYDAAGKPLIRVTSPGPVAMPMLTFLLEVDWGEGRLVREYSVLLAEPDAVAAATQPTIEAPVAAPSNTIVRDAEPVATTPMPAPAPVRPTPVPAPTPAPVASTPAPAPVANVGSRTVAPGDTLSGIAAELRGPGQSLESVMAALLRANPDAFINNDPNLLRRGATLAAPDAAAIAQAGQDGSARALQSQVAGWRSNLGRSRAAVDVASAASNAPARVAAPVAKPRAVSDARLEIMPASASATSGKGTRSGNGGEGDAEMTQQLQEARETIATRDAEVNELKSRVAELENLQKQQAQLIQMKDGQLASAQQQLNTRQQAEPQPAAAVAGQPMWIWLLPLAGILLAGLAVNAWLRRRKPVAGEGDAPSFASKKTAPVAPKAEPRLSDEMANLFPDVDEVDEEAAEATGTAVAGTRSVASTPLRKPSWVGGQAAAEPPSAQTVASSGWSVPIVEDGDSLYLRKPGTENGARAVDPAAVPSISPNDPLPRELPPGKGVFDAPEAADAMVDDAAERIALARTYFELGDFDTARALLGQVIDEGGHHAVEARRLLEGAGRT